MKGKKIIALVVAVVMTLALCFALTACGAPESLGTYAYFYAHNHKNAANPVDYSYKLEVFADGTYVLDLDYMWAMPTFDLAFARELTSYGEYTDVTPEDAEEGTHVYELALPTRIQMVSHERGSVGVVIDTDNWPEPIVEEEYAGNVKHTVSQRASGEDWADAATFLASYGRSYKVTCKDVEPIAGGAGGSMKVEITSHNGEQIPWTDAPAVVAPAAE